jgi:hypothetical protein
MRSAVAAVLAAALSFPLMSPWLTPTTSSESKLPACCRRDGKHGCAKSQKRTEGPRFKPACPEFPAAQQAPAPPLASALSEPAAAPVRFAGSVSPQSAQHDRHAQSLPLSVSPKRGPPARLS